MNHDLKASSGAGRFCRAFIAAFKKVDPSLDIVVLTSVGSGHPLEQAILPRHWLLVLARFIRIRAIFRSCDFIHALDGYPYGVIAALAGFGLGKPIFITAIGTGAIQQLWRWNGWLLAWAYRQARLVTAISRYTQREILKKVPGLAITVVHHGVDSKDFSKPLKDELTPEESALVERLRPDVLSVGGWKPRKGFEYSFPAFAELGARFPDLKYVVCGIGPKPHVTKPLGITGRVFYFKGIRWPLLRALYRNAELFLLLPVDDDKDVEGFGLVFLEAAAAGLPVVAAIGSGAEDAVADGKNAILVPQRDSHAAAEAMARILGTPDFRQRLARGSRAFAGSMTWEHVADEYLRLYRDFRPPA